MQVEVFQHFRQHVLLCPYVILLFAQEQQLRDVDFSQYAPDVHAAIVAGGDGLVNIDAACLVLADAECLAHAAEYLLDDVEECALVGVCLHPCVGGASGADVAVVGVLQRGEAVDAGQFDFVQFLVVILRESLRLDEAGEVAFIIHEDVDHRLPAGVAEEVGHVVTAEQPDARLVAEQHVEGVVHLGGDFHGVVGEEQSVLLLADFLLGGAVVLGHDQHGHLLVLLVVERSMNVHWYISL